MTGQGGKRRAVPGKRPCAPLDSRDAVPKGRRVLPARGTVAQRDLPPGGRGPPLRRSAWRCCHWRLECPC